MVRPVPTPDLQPGPDRPPDLCRTSGVRDFRFKALRKWNLWRAHQRRAASTQHLSGTRFRAGLWTIPAGAAQTDRARRSTLCPRRCGRAVPYPADRHERSRSSEAIRAFAPFANGIFARFSLRIFLTQTFSERRLVHRASCTVPRIPRLTRTRQIALKSIVRQPMRAPATISGRFRSPRAASDEMKPTAKVIRYGPLLLQRAAPRLLPPLAYTTYRPSLTQRVNCPDPRLRNGLPIVRKTGSARTVHSALARTAQGDRVRRGSINAHQSAFQRAIIVPILTVRSSTH
jgi:hypothetical protein